MGCHKPEANSMDAERGQVITGGAGRHYQAPPPPAYR